MTLWRLFGRREAKTETSQTDLEANKHAAEVQALFDDGHWDEGARLLETQLARLPQTGALLLQKARWLRHCGEPSAAMACAEQALLRSEDPGAVQMEIAECHLDALDLPAAIDALQVAVTHAPELGRAWLRLGETLMRLDRHNESIEALQRALEHSVGQAWEARCAYLLGQAHHACLRVEQAVPQYERCLALKPDHADALAAMGHAKLFLEDEPAAIGFLERLREQGPRPSRQTLSSLAIAKQHVGDLAGAREILEQLIASAPNDYGNKWYLCQLDLLECRWEEGWQRWSSRFPAGATPYRPMPYRPWDGRPIPDDCLLVMADQGIGDEILAASCFPDALSRARTVIIECEPRLQHLFRRSFPTAHIVATQRETTSAWLEGLPTPAWQIASGDLPSIFRTSDHHFPAHRGYLKPNATRTEFWRQRLATDLGTGLKIGISWRGGTKRTRAMARSLGPEHWAEILRAPSARFVNLQYGDYASELHVLQDMHGVKIHDYPEAIADYDETAALVGALDLVITVCTAIVHLAGSIGTPVWVLAPHVPAWRYTATRTSMPWYPSSRLYRQAAWGEWDTVCRKLASDLQQLTVCVTSNATSPPATTANQSQ